MNEMGHNVYSFSFGAVFFYHLQQGGVIKDAIGIECGHLCADSNYADMVDLPEPADDVLKLRCCQCEGVTTGKQDVGYLSVLADVFEGGG